MGFGYWVLIYNNIILINIVEYFLSIKLQVETRDNHRISNRIGEMTFWHKDENVLTTFQFDKTKKIKMICAMHVICIQLFN